jgi:sulfotransferase family protein
MSAAQFVDWMPSRTYWQTGRLMVDWCYLGRLRFTHPFFNETIERAMSVPFNLLFRWQTSVEWLCDLEALDPGLPPSGFIFHMSRCGSTLMTQMLAALPQNIVLSEAGPIDDILTAHLHNPTHAINDHERLRWLRGMISALGRRRHRKEEHLFIKFDCWHVTDLPLIRSAFPDVPWIFLYRDPVEVMVSHRKMPGAQMVPGVMLRHDLVDDSWRHAPPEEYQARILARVCDAALEQAAAGGLFVNYRDLPESVGPLLAKHFGIVVTPEEIECIRATAQFDAKAPYTRFEADQTRTDRTRTDRTSTDQTRKRDSATEAIRSATDKWLAPIYQRLEEQRWRVPMDIRAEASTIFETVPS